MTDNLEESLRKLEASMQVGVSISMKECLKELAYTSFLQWIKNWPTQFLIDVMQIDLTAKLNQLFYEEPVSTLGEKLNEQKKSKKIIKKK